MVRRFSFSRRLASGYLICSLFSLPCFASSAKVTISHEYNVCVASVDNFTVKRHNIIDVEQVSISTRDHKVAEFTFDELGIGAYNKVISDAAISGTTLREGSGIIVYAEIFQTDALLFVAKLSRRYASSVWIYVKFFGRDVYAREQYAMTVMRGLAVCK